MIKNPSVNSGDKRDTGLIPGLGRSPGGGPGKLLQCSCLENPMKRGAWGATVHRVAKSWTQLKRLSMQAILKPLFTPRSLHHATPQCRLISLILSGHTALF